MIEMLRIRKLLRLFKEYSPKTEQSPPDWYAASDFQRQNWDKFARFMIHEKSFLGKPDKSKLDQIRQREKINRYIRKAHELGLLWKSTYSDDTLHIELMLTDDGARYVEDWDFFLELLFAKFPKVAYYVIVVLSAILSWVVLYLIFPLIKLIFT